LPVPETHVVPDSAGGERLDAWLSTLEGLGTRSQIVAAITRGDVTVNGESTKPSRRLRGGESVEVTQCAPAPREGGAKPEDLPLDVLYADEHLVAVNKAAGMVVHPATGNRRGTLVNAILHHFPQIAEDRWPGSPDRAGIVHRLDRDTTGVILVARTVEAHEALSRQFRDRTIEKHYLALVRGDVSEAGLIEAPIGRHPRDRKRMSTSAHQTRSASTAYEPIERFGIASLLDVRPRTGRTHQIRVHLAAHGWPIVGDPTYGAPSTRALTQLRRRWGPQALTLEAMPRQALHARCLGFTHPKSGKMLVLEAPVPDDLRLILDRLRVDSRSGID